MNQTSVEKTTPVEVTTQTPKELEAEQIKQLKQLFKGTPKFNRWCQLYFDETSKETYGNATKSALAAYKLDPKKQYASAGQIGYENLKKLENMGNSIGMSVLEALGYNFIELMKIGMGKVIEGNFSDWKGFMEFIGFKKKDQEAPGMVQNFQFNLGNEIAKSRRERGLE